MDEGIVIFGASGGGIKVAQTLKSFDIDFYCFLDNDSKKWESREENTGKEIHSPELLKGNRYQIIIASEHQAEIEKQLKELGQIDNLILKEDLIIPCVEEMERKFQNEFCVKQEASRTRNRRILFDLAEGVQLGGIETWTYMVARELRKLGAEVEVFAKKTDMQPPKDISLYFTYFGIEYCNFKENVSMLAKEIIKRKPCTVIVNKHTQILYAAYIAKKMCKEGEIQVVSVIHNDLITLYRRQKRIDRLTDAVFCVSRKIQRRMAEEFGIGLNKMFYKESPVYVHHDAFFVRNYTTEGQKPLRLGYAARLVKIQKRADLFPELIEELEKRRVNYYLTIVGDGTYRQHIEEYIAKNGLEHRVLIKGSIPHEDVVDFWREQDIFLSFSDFEGSSISALEAMAQGAVPVETDVSGVREFVENGVNGFVTEVGDVARIAECICWLGRNRNQLRQMGMQSRKIIIEKCNPENYGKYMLEMCGMENLNSDMDGE